MEEGRSDGSEAWEVSGSGSGSRTAEGSKSKSKFPLALGRAAADAMIVCQAGKETRHWRAVGDEVFEGSARGKTLGCVWMD
jgi:hypothetical protein